MAPPHKRKQPESEDEDDLPLDLVERAQKNLSATESAEKGQPTPAKTLFVYGLDPSVTSQVLTEHFSESFPLKHATLVQDPTTKVSKGYAFVTFADAEDAQRARSHFNGTSLAGRPLHVELAEPRKRQRRGADTDQAVETSRPSASSSRRQAPPTPKLIVRNLPWSIKDSDQLARLFLSFGKVMLASLPKSENGRSPGFGFVCLRGRKNAERALAAMNGKQVDGRTLAVDWAVSKDAWQQSQSAPAEALQHVADEQSPQRSALKDDGALEDGDNASENATSDEALSGKGDIESDVDRATQEDLSDTQDFKTEAAETQNQDLSSTLFVRNLPFEATDEDLGDLLSSFGPLRYARVVVDPSTDRSRGTGFVCFRRAEDARQCLREAPRPSQSTMTRGTRQSTSAHASSILQDPLQDSSGRFTLADRIIHVSLAVDRSEASRLADAAKQHRSAEDRDKRRLFLLTEGTVMPGSGLHSSLSAGELATREQSARQRQSMVRNNPSLHLSLIRLSVRNIPRHVTSKDLKALAREAVVGFARDVKEGRRERLSREEVMRGGAAMKDAEHQRKLKSRGVVKQAKVVFEGQSGSKVSEGSGAGRSRGYGFIEYSSHRWALMGLRWLNGHRVAGPTSKASTNASSSVASGRPSRLIVEFAIENAQVVARRTGKERKQTSVREQGRPPQIATPRGASKGAAQTGAIQGEEDAGADKTQDSKTAKGAGFSIGRKRAKRRAAKN